MALNYYLSSVADGTMKGSVSNGSVKLAREQFLARHDIPLAETVLVRLDYETDDFCRYHDVDVSDRGAGVVHDSGIIADALFTDHSGVALFLPLADCIGMVIYDVNERAFGVSHIGRHNLEQHGARRTIEHFCQKFGIDRTDVRVFLGPTVGKRYYPIHSFDDKGMQQVALEQLAEAGILPVQIQTDDRDTADDPALFSHSQFLKGEQATDGRHAIVAVMR